MGLLRNNETKRTAVKNELDNSFLQLDMMVDKNAIILSEWIHKKCTHMRKIENRKFNKIPPKLIRGDIIKVEFGVNIGEELSDTYTDGHFAMIWAQKGFTFLVLPFTKSPQIGNDFTINIGRIEGLPEDVDTYLKLDYMKWISKARIRWINEQIEGKIIIQDEERRTKIILDIKKQMIKALIDN